MYKLFYYLKTKKILRNNIKCKRKNESKEWSGKRKGF